MKAIVDEQKDIKKTIMTTNEEIIDNLRSKVKELTSENQSYITIINQNKYDIIKNEENNKKMMLFLSENKKLFDHEL